MNRQIRVAVVACAVVLAAAAGVVVATHGRGFDRQAIEAPAATQPATADEISAFTGRRKGTPPTSGGADFRPALDQLQNTIMPCGDRGSGLIAGGGGPTVYTCVRGHRFIKVQGAFVPYGG